jgi:hypothetical protein
VFEVNRRGNFADVSEWIVVAFAVVVVVGLVMLFISNFDSNIQGLNESIASDQIKAGSAEYKDSLFSGLDILFIFLFVSFVGFSVMSARLIPSSPKFIIISIFALIALPFVAMIVENIWTEWFNQASLNAVYSEMVFLPYLMNHFTVVVLFYCVAVAISLLSKEGGVFNA